MVAHRQSAFRYILNRQRNTRLGAHPVVLEHHDDITLDNQAWLQILRPLVYRCDWETQQLSLSEAALIENGYRKDHLAVLRPAPNTTLSHLHCMLHAAAVRHCQEELDVGAMVSVNVAGACREIEDVASRVEHRPHRPENALAIPEPSLALAIENGAPTEPSLALALPKHDVHDLVFNEDGAVKHLSCSEFAEGSDSLKNHVFFRFAVPKPSKLKHVKQTSGLTAGFDQEDSLVVLQDALSINKSERSVSVTDRQVQSSFDELGVWRLPELAHKNLRLALVLWKV